MTRHEERTLALTENIGAWLADINEEVERIHYDPERATERDIENLERIIEHITFIERLAKDTCK